MNKYFLVELDDCNFNYLVISLTYESILIFIKSLEKKIKKSDGLLIFDLALVNGNKNNRYIVANFKKKKIDLQSFEPVSYNCISKDLKKISWNYFINHKDILNNSTLNQQEINKLLKQ